MSRRTKRLLREALARMDLAAQRVEIAAARVEAASSLLRTSDDPRDERHPYPPEPPGATHH